MEVEETKFNWGILGAGKIARKLVKSSWSVPGCKVLAVASNTPGKAADFASDLEIEKAYGCYEDLVADPEIDIVYIANTHNSHESAALMALQAGKHVLCEKPLAVNAEQAGRMISTARKNQRFLMEGMWTRFLPAIQQVRSWLKQQRIGKVKQVHASFGIDLMHVQRITDPNLAGGALLDLGIYPISFASMVCDGEVPVSIHSTVEKLETGVDGAANMLFEYSTGVWADLKCSCMYALPTEAWIIGEKGLIQVPADFYASQKAILTVEGDEEFASFPAERQQSFKYQMKEVQDCIQNGLLESKAMPLDETLAIARTMDNLRNEWGIRYPFE